MGSYGTILTNQFEGVATANFTKVCKGKREEKREERRGKREERRGRREERAAQREECRLSE